jgi:uncharacterized protein with HEPN domain
MSTASGLYQTLAFWPRITLHGLFCFWDAACVIREFVVGKNFNHYTRDRLLRGAVERHIQIIGEAARNVSQSFRDVHSEIPWRKIIAQRHVLAHEYGELKHDGIAKSAF